MAKIKQSPKYARQQLKPQTPQFDHSAGIPSLPKPRWQEEIGVNEMAPSGAMPMPATQYMPQDPYFQDWAMSFGNEPLNTRPDGSFNLEGMDLRDARNVAMRQAAPRPMADLIPNRVGLANQVDLFSDQPLSKEQAIAGLMEYYNTPDRRGKPVDPETARTLEQSYGIGNQDGVLDFRGMDPEAMAMMDKLQSMQAPSAPSMPQMQTPAYSYQPMPLRQPNHIQGNQLQQLNNQFMNYQQSNGLAMAILQNDLINRRPQMQADRFNRRVFNPLAAGLMSMFGDSKEAQKFADNTDKRLAKNEAEYFDNMNYLQQLKQNQARQAFDFLRAYDTSLPANQLAQRRSEAYTNQVQNSINQNQYKRETDDYKRKDDAYKQKRKEYDNNRKNILEMLKQKDTDRKYKQKEKGFDLQEKSLERLTKHDEYQKQKDQQARQDAAQRRSDKKQAEEKKQLAEADKAANRAASNNIDDYNAGELSLYRARLTAANKADKPLDSVPKPKLKHRQNLTAKQRALADQYHTFKAQMLVKRPDMPEKEIVAAFERSLKK